MTGVGWLTLSSIAFAGAVPGRSLIHGDEPLVFLGVLAAGILFEMVWRLTCGTNAVTDRTPGQSPRNVDIRTR